MSVQKPRVSIVRVADYANITEAVRGAIRLLGDLGFSIGGEDRVLLKPNLLLKRAEACTAPELMLGVVDVLKEHPNHIQIGDSPGHFKANGRAVLEHLGVWEPLQERGVEYVEFEGERAVAVESPVGARMRRYHVAAPVVEADVLVNLPRPKSHIETTYTGAIKNYWGIIPGGQKAKGHIYGKGPMGFARVLVDNYTWVRTHKPCRLTVMDATQVMEGSRGPGNGHLNEWGLILAGTDEVAVDGVLLAIGSWVAHEKVPHLKVLAELGIGPAGLDGVEVMGRSVEEVRRAEPFDLPGDRLSRAITFFTGTMMYRVVRKVPKLDLRGCVRCGDCARLCPVQAISWEKGGYPAFDLRNKCISCLCCAECCPQQTIEMAYRGLVGLFDRYLPEDRE